MRPTKRSDFFNLFLILPVVFLFGVDAHSQDLDEIGVTLLRAMTTNLDGTGIRLAQAEAQLSTNPPTWEVNPANVGRPVSLFSYASSAGSASSYPSYPNNLGTNSWHAEHVGNNFYGIPDGVATNAAHIDNYEADFFFNSIVNGTPPSNINDAIANQSFIFGTVPVSTQQEIDSAYDNYAVNFKALFFSGAGNGSPVNVTPPGTSYNGMCVGVSDGASSVGPTTDNGRCKPDIIAPGSGATSFSTPYVAGTAAVLMQAALRGDGGTDTNSASDIRMIKALLMNGAVKPSNWTNATFSPLDMRYGAGMLNAYNSYKQLTGGKHAYIVSTSTTSGGAHPPIGASGTESSLNAWDLNAVSSTGGIYGVNHYYFNVTNGVSNAVFTATATLIWNRPASASYLVHSTINNLSLFLFNAANSNLVMVSTSMVDNVQHIFVPRLAPGRYDLQVLNAGGSSVPSGSETYALAWAFTAPSLTVAKSGANVVLSWPAYPAGFEVVGTANLLATPWSTSGLPSSTFANGTNTMTVPAANNAQFFRLYEPNF